MKRILVLAVMGMWMHVANAGVIDIIETPSGDFQIFTDGELHSTSSTRAGAEKAARVWEKQGNTINWKKAPSSSAGAAPNVGATTKAATTPPSGQKLLNAAPEQKLLPQNAASSTSQALTTTPKTTPATTGTQQKLLNAAPEQKLLPQNAASSASQPKMLPETAASSAPKPTSGGGATPPKTTTPTPKPTSGTPKASAAGVAGTALTVGLGVMSVVDGVSNINASVKASEEKTTWSDIGTGALGGAEVTGGAAMIVNAIPVGGQVAYGASIAVGAVVGAAGAGTKMFSQTDCDRDPVTGQYACCNVVKAMSNMDGARYCNIGDEMFAGFPYVRTCMQGKNKFESNWFVARFLDDHWSDTAEVKFCKGYQMPANGNYKIQPIASSEAAGKVCWMWECADPNMTRQGNKCVSAKCTCPDDLKDASVPCRADQTKMGATKCYRKCHANCQGATIMIAECKSGTTPAEPNAGWKLNGKPLYAKCVAKQNQNQTTAAAAMSAAGSALNQTSVTNPDTQPTPESDVNPTNIPDADVTPAFKCDGSKLVTAAGWRGKYALYPDVVMAANNLINACNAGQIESQVTFDIKWAELTELVAAADVAIAAAAEQAARQQSQKRISDAANKLQYLTDGLGVSVWKTADGNFNGARLASDSVAGVVLGTAGGLITSSVVKKNQIKNGFEDIKCTIGGQSVADYGDEFTVGVK